MTRLPVPTEVADSLDFYLARHDTRGRGIYLTVLVLVVSALIALPLVRVRVTVASSGVLRPSVERHILRSPSNGTVTAVPVGLGQTVEAGDTLLILGSEVVVDRIRGTDARKNHVDRAIADLEVMLSGPWATADAVAAIPVESTELAAERDELAAEMREREVRQGWLADEASRGEALARSGLIAAREVEDRRRAFAEGSSSLEAALARFRSRWRTRLTAFEAERNDLVSEHAALRAELARYTVRAPVRGTIEEQTALSPGSLVQSGDVIGVISPDEKLIAESLVAPSEVGLIEAGMPVRVHVDAFDYGDWGFLQGHVTRVSEDVVALETGPAFRITIELDESRLRLSSGASARMRKGMSVRALFVVTERSLLQLLRDDVADWINPRRGGRIAAAGT